MESHDDVLIPPASSGAAITEQRKRRALTAAAVGGSYLADAVLFTLFAEAGRISFSVPAGYLAAGGLATLLFVLLHLSGAAERRKDPMLVIEQMSVAICLQLATLYLAPALTMYCLGLMFLIFAFGIPRLTSAQALTLWAISSAAFGLVLYQHDFIITVNFGTTFEGVLAWLAYATILLRGIGVTIFANAARQRSYADKLKQAQDAESAKALVSHDSLTGALNRHAILPMVEHQISLASRSKEAFAVCMLDLDHFQLINAHFGHATGDSVLARITTLARDILRTSDQIGRYGGEEFLILLPGSSGHEAISVIERLRSGIEGHAWSALADGLEVRISAGIAPFATGDTVQQLVSRADYGLSKAKHGGRNRVVYVGGE